MTIAGSARRVSTRILFTSVLGALFAVGASSPLAMADETEYGDDTVNITVVIAEFDPCSVGASGCEGSGGSLANTGATVGAAVAGTVLLTAVGIGTVVATRRRGSMLTRSSS